MSIDAYFPDAETRRKPLYDADFFRERLEFAEPLMKEMFGSDYSHENLVFSALSEAGKLGELSPDFVNELAGTLLKPNLLNSRQKN